MAIAYPGWRYFSGGGAGVRRVPPGVNVGVYGRQRECRRLQLRLFPIQEIQERPFVGQAPPPGNQACHRMFFHYRDELSNCRKIVFAGGLWARRSPVRNPNQERGSFFEVADLSFNLSDMELASRRCCLVFGNINSEGTLWIPDRYDNPNSVIINLWKLIWLAAIGIAIWNSRHAQSGTRQ